MEGTAPVQRTSALSKAAKKHSECARVAMTTERIELETDSRRLEQRIKQVEKGKQTPEYRRFRALVPESSREHVRLLHPTEPDPREKMSARLWNLRLKTWRRCLHDYDPAVDVPAPYVSARWVYAVQKTAERIPEQRLQECGDALERRARELSPEAASAALGSPEHAATRWNRASVQKVFQLLDQLDGAKGKGLLASPEPQAQTELYELPAALCISVASTAQEVSRALLLLTAACASCPVLGLDVEWVASPSGSDEVEERVVLLQLSTETHCLLVRLAALDAIPDCLAKLLADKHVLKCGVSIAHDVDLLQAQYALAVHGVVDLAALAHSCGSDSSYKYTRDGLGLNAIIQSVLGYHLAKDVSVRCGDWSADLTAQQIYYAACDAHAAQRALLQLHQGHVEAGASTVAVFEWCCGHAVVDHAVGRAERALMRSQAEKAQRTSASSTSHEQPERAGAKASTHPSPPLSAVRSPDHTVGDDEARSSDTGHPAHQAGCACVAASGSGSLAAGVKSNAPPASDVTAELSILVPTPVTSVPKGRWGSPAEVRRQLFC